MRRFSADEGFPALIGGEVHLLASTAIVPLQPIGGAIGPGYPDNARRVYTADQTFFCRAGVPDLVSGVADMSVQGLLRLCSAIHEALWSFMVLSKAVECT